MQNELPDRFRGDDEEAREHPRRSTYVRVTLTALIGISLMVIAMDGWALFRLRDDTLQGNRTGATAWCATALVVGPAMLLTALVALFAAIRRGTIGRLVFLAAMLFACGLGIAQAIPGGIMVATPTGGPYGAIDALVSLILGILQPLAASLAAGMTLFGARLIEWTPKRAES